MKIKIILPAIILFPFSVIYFSCDTITSPTSNISGKVYSYNYLAVSNVKVTIRDQSALTSEDGSFTFKNITLPYDLIVMDSLERNVTVYKGINAEDILLPLKFSVYNNNFATINVTTPINFLQSNISGKIIFTDGNFVNSYSDMIQNDPKTSVWLNINETTMGKLFLFTYKKDNGGNILSYENYGESPDIQILPGGNYTYQFDSLDLSLNPGEQNVTGSIQLPSNSNLFSPGFYLSLSSKKTYYSSSKFSRIDFNIFNFVIPSGIPIQFNTIIQYNSYGGIVSSCYEDLIVYPNVPNVITVKFAPAIISPDDNIKHVTNNTQFSFSEGTGSGIYIINLFNRSRNVEYKIVTSDKNFTLEGLEDLGLGRINNNNFDWSVQKIGPVNSINDYVTNFFNEPNNFITESESRTFWTEP